MARFAWLIAAGVGLATSASCGASLPQVPKGRPHGVVVLGFEHASKQELYEYRVRVDGHEAAKVGADQRLRLAPGAHTLELEAIGTRYKLGDEVVLERVCADPYCTYQRYTSVTRPAMLPVGTRRCAAQVELQLAAETETRVVLEVSADFTCTAHVKPR